jgi:hypothetical protein
MSARNILPAKESVIELGGNKYTIKFTMSNSAKMSLKYGTPSGAIKLLQGMNPVTVTVEQLTALADLISSALVKNHPEMTAQYISDTFEILEVLEVFPEVLACYLESMGIDGGKVREAGNPPKP